MIELVFDTETTGLIKPYGTPAERQPQIIELAWVLLEDNEIIKEKTTFIKPKGITKLDDIIVKITGITMPLLDDAPHFNSSIVEDFFSDVSKAETVVAHNLTYDMEMVNYECERHNLPRPLWGENKICTVENSECVLGRRMNLGELYKEAFDEQCTDNRHRALDDVKILAKVYKEMKNADMF